MHEGFKGPCRFIANPHVAHHELFTCLARSQRALGPRFLFVRARTDPHQWLAAKSARGPLRRITSPNIRYDKHDTNHDNNKHSTDYNLSMHNLTIALIIPMRTNRAIYKYIMIS